MYKVRIKVYSKEEKEKYLCHKKWMAAIFSSYNMEDSDYDVDGMIKLKEVVEFLCENNFMNFDIRNKIYNILSYARNLIDKNYSSKVEIINSIIITLNLSNNNFMDFYRYQEKIRTGNIFALFSFFEPPKERIQFINECVMLDYFIAMYYLGYIDSFVLYKMVKFYNLEENYDESLNMVLTEFPSIKEDCEVFLRRKCDILNYLYPDSKNSQKIKK